MSGRRCCFNEVICHSSLRAVPGSGVWLLSHTFILVQRNCQSRKRFMRFTTVSGKVKPWHNRPNTFRRMKNAHLWSQRVGRVKHFWKRVVSGAQDFQRGNSQVKTTLPKKYFWKLLEVFIMVSHILKKLKKLLFWFEINSSCLMRLNLRFFHCKFTYCFISFKWNERKSCLIWSRTKFAWSFITVSFFIRCTSVKVVGCKKLTTFLKVLYKYYFRANDVYSVGEIYTLIRS